MKKIFMLFVLSLVSLIGIAQIPFPTGYTQHTLDVSGGDWEEPSNWSNNVVPPDDAVVIIPANKTVTIKTELTQRYKLIRVEGDLYMTIHNNTRLLAETIHITNTGYFRIGLPNFRVNDNKTAEVVIINDGNPIDTNWDFDQISRGFVSIGKVDVFGKIKTNMVEVNADVFAGTSIINVNNTIPADWEVGDQIVLPGTIFERLPEPANVGFICDRIAPENDVFQDEKLTIKSISGQSIEVEETIAHDHIRVRTDMPLHLANLSRNIVFRSESTDIPLRGHVMLMNDDGFVENNVRIEHTAFIDLGRTDKAIPLDDRLVDITVPTSVTENGAPRTNIRGRYAVHFHKNGYDASNNYNTPPSSVVGCVVEGTPGWGFVNHSSHVDIRENICYDFVGAGFVTETGDELGNFFDNIAIKGTGNGKYKEIRLVFTNTCRPQPLADFAFSGDGFWFQGPAVRTRNNVAANCNGTGMIWFSIGSVEMVDIDNDGIKEDVMIGMKKDIMDVAYSSYPDAASIKPRSWDHATDQVFLADYPILECDGFQAYACLAGFRLRFNNSPTNAFFNADFNQDGVADRWGYNASIKPANGYNTISQADRVDQNIHNLKLWNNEIGIRARYSSKTNFQDVTISNKLRYDEIYPYYPAISCFHQITDFEFCNLYVENYGVGMKNIEDLEDEQNPPATFCGNENDPTFVNTATDIYDVTGEQCGELQNIFSKNISATSTEINFYRDPYSIDAVVRYRPVGTVYWEYAEEATANTILLTGLLPNTQYEYQVISGCEYTPSYWSEVYTFQTMCQDLNCGYAIGSQWSYGSNCVAPVCVGDYLRLRVQVPANTGTSTWTGPNGYTGTGNSYNTIFLNPFPEDGYGIYTATYTNEDGCVSTKTFEVVPKNDYQCGYAIGNQWTYGNDCVAPVCVGQSVRLRLNTTEGTTTWTGPNGYTGTGNANNTIFLNPFPEDGYGTYTATHTDNEGCTTVYDLEVVPKNDYQCGYAIGSQWTYGDCTAPVCIDDDIRLRLNTTEGTTTWTGPNGYTGTGNANNTIFLNPFPEDGYGTYYASHTDDEGCTTVHELEVVPTYTVNFAYSINGTIFTSPTNGQIIAPLGSNIRIRVVANTGTSEWEGPNGYTSTGNAYNTIFLNDLQYSDDGTYTVVYENADGCAISQSVELIVLGIKMPISIVGSKGGLGFVGKRSLEELSSSNLNLSVYPNPIHNYEKLNLVFHTDQAGMQNFSIWDVNQKLIKEFTFEAIEGKNNIAIDIQNLPAGMFFLKNAQGQNIKFVVFD